MPLWTVALALAVIIALALVATWAARRPTLAAPFRYLIVGIVVVLIVMIALRLFGVWGDVKNFRVERTSEPSTAVVLIER